MMPHSQKSQHCKLEQGLQVPKDAQGLVGVQAPEAEKVNHTTFLLFLYSDPGHLGEGVCFSTTWYSPEFSESLLLLHYYQSHSMESI